MNASNRFHILVLIVLFALAEQGVIAQYQPSAHKNLPVGVIPVSSPGNYGVPGTTYMLTRDISSPQTAIFLGKNVTLDLNGYTITFADGDYDHVPNYGFEEGVDGWDLSKAPGASIRSTKDHAFIGEKLMSLKAGDEIVSGPVNLPVPDRSYYAMCGLTGNYYNEMGGDLSKDMRVSIFVEDEHGKEVRCTTTYGDTTMQTCPVMNRSARLGGGFIVAHLNGLPAGKYRIRIKAENDCLVDQVDIRPAMDVGIGIVDRTHPYGSYDHLYNIVHSAFFDYTSDVSNGKPDEGIPVAEGAGTIVIKNGIIRNGTVGVMSWGIQSTAEDAGIILDNIRIITSGINTTAVDVPQATITNCRFDVTNPFIINRHGSQFYAVDLRGEKPSEVSFSEFYGAQGCLVSKGLNSKIYHNHFVNRQTVTNHYSVMAMGDGSSIFENRFEPEIGSGLEIFRHKNILIFNNVFVINAAPPSCEYHEHYSTNAIRIADYGAELGSPTGSYGNMVFNNKFYITGKKYHEYPNFIPMASAFFFSASAGDNEVFGNLIMVNQEDPGTDAEAFGFYIGNARGGKLYNNRIISNVTPIWVGSSYGRATRTVLSRNIIEKAPGAPSGQLPIRMGSYEQPTYLSDHVEFRSNEFTGWDFAVDATDQENSYYLYNTLTITVMDKDGKPAENAEVSVSDSGRKNVKKVKTDTSGKVTMELADRFVEGKKVTMYSPYMIVSGKSKQEVQLSSNREVILRLK